jgi:hypothetical protein
MLQLATRLQQQQQEQQDVMLVLHEGISIWLLVVAAAELVIACTYHNGIENFK